jgi:hypothetical protein
MRACQFSGNRNASSGMMCGIAQNRSNRYLGSTAIDIDEAKGEPVAGI